jgi:uncharacterized protein (TIGR02145 family)
VKRIITIYAAILLTASVFAQAPNKMSYQAVIRNNSNALVTDQTVGMRISILQGSASGSSVYVETQAPITNSNGLVSIEIGGGTVVSGNFSSINWGNGPYFCKTETDPNGGITYSITGTSQLLSVPYALFSGNGIIGVTATGDSLLLGNGTSIIIPGISGANNTGGQIEITQHTCGADSVHNPNLNYGSMTDQQGIVYKTIVIGNQEWMAENLKTSIYRNGEPIATNLTNAEWENTINTQIGAWTFYNNDSLYDCPYGKLYNWYAVADSRHVCPTGWHVPTDGEWTILTDYLGGGAVAGGKMKSTGTQYWVDPNQDATNESGFSGLPGGSRDYYDVVGIVGDVGNWWSSSENGANSAWYRVLGYNNGSAYQFGNDEQSGFSVRCLKD